MRKIIPITLAIIIGFGLSVDVTTNGVTGEPQAGFSYIKDAVAKGFRSSKRSFSSRSVKVRNYKSRTTTTTKPKAKAPKVTKVAAKRAPTAFEKAGKRKSSKQAAAKSREKFAKSSTPTQARSSVATARTTPVGRRLDNVDRNTYYSKRSAAQAKYSANSRVPQTVIYQSSSSFGVYDSWFMWHVVLSDHSFGYNHYNDPGYMQWRREARRLSSDNAELREQLKVHESGIAAMSGTPNAEYIPEGIDADVIFAPAMVAAAVPTLTLCTGSTDGTYFRAGSGYDNLVADSDIKLVATRGSVQNLEMLKAGNCDAAFVQRDAYLVFDKANPDSDFHLTRLGTLYNENAHLVCSRERDVDHLDQLSGNSDVQLYVGELGSGAAVTWSNFVSLNDEFSNIKVVNKPLSNGSFGEENHCGLYVGKNKSTVVKNVKHAAFRMVDIETVPVNEIKDPGNNNVYSIASIDGGTYDSQHGWNDTGMFSSTSTVSVPVDFVVSDTWKNNTNGSDKVLAELVSLRASIVGAL